MKNTLIYPIGSTKASIYASDLLCKRGFPVTDHPTPEVTHLFLDVPSFRNSTSSLPQEDFIHLLSMLPENITVVGGLLNHPFLQKHQTWDFLNDAYYLAKNAAITADCALRIAAPLMSATFSDSPALILGWGRIGKCLAQLLRNLGCPVTIAARKEQDQALIRALGYHATDFVTYPDPPDYFRLLFNTVPAPVFDRQQLSHYPNCIKIDLASQNGLDGDNVIIARGLPGSHAPISSGKLLADTFFRFWKEVS